MDSIRDKTAQHNTGVTLEGVLELAKAGYPVFPLNAETKHPANAHGFYGGTTKESKIRQINWSRHKVAIATGLAAELVVIEADGPDGVAYLREHYGPETVKTSKGAHWYFDYPEDKTTSGPLAELQKILGTQEDIHCKADGGYVEAPPSPTKQWVDGLPDRDALPPLPRELRKPKRDARKRGTRQHSDELIGKAAETIARHVADLRGGSRHQHLKHMCGTLLPRMEHDDAEILLVEAWSKVSDELAKRAPHEVPNTLRTTAEALEDGRATGIPKMEELTPGIFDELNEVFGWEPKIKSPTEEKVSPEERKARADQAWAVCERLAKSDNILSEIYALQEQDGLIGEEACAKIMQLIAVTRYKGQPMSVIVNGESSGGKSFLLKETVKTLPEEAVHVLQSISDKALAYIGENTLTDKFLQIYELGGLGKEGEQGLEMVKQLLTEGRIDRQIAESTGKGVRGRRVYAEGPTGLWTTTTKNVVDAELQNRALTLTIDESPAQTERIIKGRKSRKKRRAADFGPVKALHTWLAGQGGDVEIPFEDVIAEGVDTRAVRMRRFYSYIMELVEAHALLHRATRKVDVDGFVLAAPEDYATVYELVKDIVAVAAEVAVSDSQRETVEAAKLVIESDKPLTSNTLAERLEIARSTASRRLGAATREGYLKHDPDAKGKTKVYVMGDIKLPDKAAPAIPAPEDIEERARAAYDEVCKCATCAPTPAPSDADGVKSVLKCADPDCTHAAHMEAGESASPPNPHTYGESENGTPAKNVDFGPPVHTLHTCTHQENGHERANVHAAVQGAVHASEGGDPPLVDTPLGKAPPWLWRMYLRRHVLRYIRRAKRIADVFENDPARYDEMPEKDREALRVWVRKTVVPKPKITHAHSSYALKEYAEADLGIYVHNAWFKAAMLEAGHAPAWDNRINMGFRAGPSYSWMHPKKRAQIQARKEQEARWQAELEQVEAELEELRAAHIAKYGEAPDAWTKEQL